MGTVILLTTPAHAFMYRLFHVVSIATSILHVTWIFSYEKRGFPSHPAASPHPGVLLTPRSCSLQSQHGSCHFVSSLVSIFGPGPPGAVFSVLPFSLIVFLCFPCSPPSESPPTSAPAGPGCLPSPCGMWLGSGVSTGREREGEMGKRCVWRRGQWGH